MELVAKEPLNPSAHEDEDIFPAWQITCAAVAVQIINAADWSVILPLDRDISTYVGLDHAYAYEAVLVSIVYCPYPISLFVLKRIDNAYTAYLYWAVFCILGNILYIVMMLTRPPGVSVWLIVARLMQGFAQPINYSIQNTIAITTSVSTRAQVKGWINSANNFGYAVGLTLCATLIMTIGKDARVQEVPLYLIVGPVSITIIAIGVTIFVVVAHPQRIVPLPAEVRLKQGRAGMSSLVGCFGNFSDEATRKMRIVGSCASGFIRISARTGFQAIAIDVLHDECGMRVVPASLCLAAVAVLTVIFVLTASRFFYIQSDEAWLRVFEVINFVGVALLFVVDRATSGWHTATFLLAFICINAAGAMNAIITNASGSKYAIDSSFWWDTRMVQVYIMITGNVGGKFFGPVLAKAFHAQGGTIYAAYMVSMAVLGSAVANIFLREESKPPVESSSEDESSECEMSTQQ